MKILIIQPVKDVFCWYLSMWAEHPIRYIILAVCGIIFALGMQSLIMEIFNQAKGGGADEYRAKS